MVIVLVAFLVLGPEKLSAAAHNYGKKLKEFKMAASSWQRQINNLSNLAPTNSEGTSPVRSTDRNTKKTPVTRRPRVRAARYWQADSAQITSPHHKKTMARRQKG